MIGAGPPYLTLHVPGADMVTLPREVYLSAPMDRAFRMREYGTTLASRGFRVVSTWLTTLATKETYDQRRYVAAGDLRELDRAGVLLAFTERPGRYFTGGRHVELGYALGMRKVVVVIGPDENVFHCHPGVLHRFEGWGAFLSALETR